MGSRIKPHRPVLQRGHPSARGLVLALPFWERGGATVQDEVRQLPVALVSNPTRTTGQFGPQVSVSGGSHISVTDHPVLDVPGSATIALWVRPSTTTALDVLAARWKDSAGDNKRAFALALNDDTGVIRFDTSDTGSFVAGNKATSANALQDGIWAHVVAVHNAAGLTNTIYLNGVQDGQATGVSAGLFATDIPLQIGAADFGGTLESAAADFADVRFWSRALPPAEVLSLYLDPWAMYRPTGRGTLANTLQPALPRRLMQTIAPQNLQHLTF